jgi:hypothetical protein
MDNDLNSHSNPLQCKRFGDYQNIHLASSPDMAEPVIHSRVKKSVCYSITLPMSKNTSDLTLNNEEMIKTDKLSVKDFTIEQTPSLHDTHYATKEFEKSPLFANFEDQKRKEKESDPYAAFKNASGSTKSIFDSSNDTITPFPTVFSYPSSSPSSSLFKSSNDTEEFGEFVGAATTLIPSNTNLKFTTNDNILNAGLIFCS